jgi:ABC-type transporter Mla maintaining outer membrane lipid asymmetry ATPase subunit MlaF
MFLFDEATTGLDPINASAICSLISELCQTGIGLMFVTHQVSDALKVAERFIYLSSGKMIFDGDREQLMSTDNPEIKTYLRDHLLLSKNREALHV